MAVPKYQVSSWQQAYDYMVGSMESATKGVCPGAASVYSAFAAKYSEADIYEGPFNKSVFLADLASADAACKASPDYAPKLRIPTAPAGTISPDLKIDPATGGAAPSQFEIVKAAVPGLPWWVWLLGGGAVLYFLFGKDKKKGGKKRKK